MRTLLMVVLALAPSTSVPARDGELERSLAILDHLDESRITLEYDDESLLRVLDEMSLVLPYAIVADWDALESIGVEMRTSVSLHARDASALTVLRGIAAQVGDEYEWPTLEAFGGQVVLTTPDAAGSMRLTDVYDVRDLITREGVVESLRPAMPDETPGPRSGADGTGADPSATDPSASEPADSGALSPVVNDEFVGDGDAPPPTPGETLARLVMEHVDPEGWVAFGGLRGITDRDGVLMISATPMTHRRLRDALNRLRRAYPEAITLRAALVELPRTTVARLSRRYDDASEALAGALLVAPERTVLWESTSSVKLGQMMSTSSSQSDRSIHVEVTPTLDERGVLSLAIDAETTRGASRRAVSTTAAIAGLYGGAVVELSAVVHGETARLLVLLPERR